MQLSDYLAREGLSYAEFARRCGTKHARTIERIAKGAKLAGSRMRPRIIAATGGEVTANDLYSSASAVGVMIETAPGALHAAAPER